MREYQLVDRATVMPQACICGSIKGPFVDTFYERWGEHIYLCVACLKRAAVAAGLGDGAKMDELSHAHDTLAAKDAELDAARAAVEELRATVGAHQRKTLTLQTQLEEALERERLRARIADEIAGAASQLQQVG